MNGLYLSKKRMDILKTIKPICELFGIEEYDYIVKESGQLETLVLDGTPIGCSGNSTIAVVDELIGYLFIEKWCKHRCLGAFEKQSTNVITRNWL
jgi:hypothetical protein